MTSNLRLGNTEEPVGHAAHRCQGLERFPSPQSLLIVRQASLPAVPSIPSGRSHAIDHATIVLKRGLLLVSPNHQRALEQLVSLTSLIAKGKNFPAFPGMQPKIANIRVVEKACNFWLQNSQVD